MERCPKKVEAPAKESPAPRVFRSDACRYRVDVAYTVSALGLSSSMSFFSIS
jgi:hypothetical protein